MGPVRGPSQEVANSVVSPDMAHFQVGQATFYVTTEKEMVLRSQRVRVWHFMCCYLIEFWNG